MPSSPPSGRAVRVLLADDQKLFAESLMAVLSQDERVEVVGIAANGEEAVRLARDLEPDVILMDLKMPVMGRARSDAQNPGSRPARPDRPADGNRHVVRGRGRD
jgi:CheY-like chemotaxis protein